jgi:hypothetical protein
VCGPFGKKKKKKKSSGSEKKKKKKKAWRMHASHMDA